MKVRHIACAIGLTLVASGAMASEKENKGEEKSLYERLTKKEKKGDSFNFYLNMHNDLSFNWDAGKFQEADFRFRQLRLEAKGNINDWIYYRWRQRLTRGKIGDDPVDNLPGSIDYAAVGFKVTPQFSIFAGKQSTVYGGFEFDLNPIDIYQYSDMVDYMSNFMTGVTFIYDVIPTQQLCLQILNSTSNSFEQTYGIIPVDDIPAEDLPSYLTTGVPVRESRFPLAYTFNWNGSFLDNMIRTRWSATILQEAKKKNMYYYAMGTELNLGKVNTFFDFMYSREAIDRKGIVSEIVNRQPDGNIDGVTAMNAKYMSFVWKLNYRFCPKWNVFFKGMFETQGLSQASNNVPSGKLRNSWGYIAGVEYYPMNSNLHFFLTFVGRTYDYTQAARTLGWENYNTQRLSCGFIYQLPMY